MTKKILCFICALTMLLGINAFALSDDITYLYVSQSGNDNANGSENAPFKTVEKARDTLRQMKQNGTIGKSGAVVYIREGTYTRTDSILFEVQDSGTADAPIVYRNYPNEKVDFIGGVKIQKSEFSPVTDESVIAKFPKICLKNKILQFDLKTLGITQLPEPYWAGNYSYNELMTAVHGKTTPEKSPELFINNEVQTIARYPNNENLTIKTIVENGAVPANWQESKKGTAEYVPPEERIPTPFTIGIDYKELKRWETAKDALLWGMWKFSWADQTVPLKSVDPEAGTITSMYPSLFGIGLNQPFYVYNLLEELDCEGEYYIDRNNLMLYTYPKEDAGEFEAVLSLAQNPIFELQYCQNMSVKGINIFYSKGIGVHLNNCTNVTVENCETGYLADKGIRIDGGKRCGAKNNYVHDTDGGIAIQGGDRETLTSCNHYIENNRIERYSRIRKTYNPAIEMYTVGGRAMYNQVSDGGHLALLFWGNENTIAYNEFFNCANQADDMGVIYQGRSLTMLGNKIMYNYIHDIKSSANTQLGVHGVYLDDGFSGGYVYGNVMENVTGYGVHLTGRDCDVKNNIFVNVSGAITLMDYRDMEGTTGQYLLNDLKAVPYESDIWKAKYPQLLGMDKAIFPSLHKNNNVTGNLCYNSARVKLAQNVPSDWGKDENNLFVTTDPGFYDLENRNYLLKKDSIAYSKIEGFEPVPFTRMGLYDERAKARVKNAVALALYSPYSIVNGGETLIDSSDKSIAPRLYGDYTIVPLRFLAEALNAQVEYSEQNGDITITSGDTVLKLNKNSDTAYKNGAEIKLSVNPQVISDRTFVPLRQISELFDKQVFWDKCGLITISDTENLLDNSVDKEIIDYIHEKININ